MEPFAANCQQPVAYRVVRTLERVEGSGGRARLQRMITAKESNTT